ncbi:hypothetical protein A1OO_10925 [Enterovibrio norvegicus FF-33]|uniref:hypothetical protein n=1 Tax=Enterovibrio norvegicus TaxID=188144 RepID=UPI0002F83E7D|nr:hypothetical protein [Enterovibrio norvegicus]OEE66295.1 hypothetical protein A1OO_10925 [Enterovibrio norvegicus FF-33]
MKKIALVPLAILLAAPVFAQDGDIIDPADVTKVYTQAGVLLSGNSDIQLQGQISGGLENGQQFALLAEAYFKDEDRNANDFGSDYTNSRFQYFHVFEPGFHAVPKLGFSVDYINTRDDAAGMNNDLISIGGVAAINPAYTAGLLVFPRLGVITGDIELTQQGIDDSVSGFSAGLITAKYLGDSGSYLHFTPEYQSVSGDTIEMDTVSFKAGINAPLNSARTWWVNTRFDYTKTSLSTNNIALPSDWQSEVWFGIRKYF